MATIKHIVTDLSEDERNRVHDVVRSYVSSLEYEGWTKLQNIRHAFRLIRKWVAAGYDLKGALDCVDDEAWAINENRDMMAEPPIGLPSKLL